MGKASEREVLTNVNTVGEKKFKQASYNMLILKDRIHF
jgi:hypothetical protein